MTLGDEARKKLARSSDGDDYRRRGIVLEASLFSLMMRRRKSAKTDAAVIDGLSSAIVSGRQAARSLGRESVAAVADVTETVKVSTRAADALHAQRIARNHLDELLKAESAARGSGAENPRREALADTEYQVRTIAASETFQAASDEVNAAAEEASQAGIKLEKRWNAEPDACELCSPMHDEQVPYGEDFSSGEEPGDVHANCRCWLEIVTA